MTKEELERERRQGRIAGIAGLIGLFIFLGAGVANLAPDYNGAEGLADQLAVFPSEKDGVLAQSILQMLAVLLFAFPLAALFRSALARSESARPQLFGAVLLGPILFAASVIALYFAVDAAVDPFLNGGGDIDTSSDDDASDVFGEQGPSSLYIGLAIAGRIGLVFGMVYTALHAMRSGLLTRFWGTLAMALGAGFILIGPQALILFTLLASLLVADLWRRGRPPAWEAGVGIPWPKPGEEPSATRTETDEEIASPEDFEGTATEVPSERPGRRDNKRKRKRKQR